MNEKTLEKLNKLLELSQNDTVTPKELGNFLVMVLDVIKKSKGEFDKISSENVQIIKDSIDFIETSHSKILSQVDEQNGKLIEDTDKKLKQAQDMFNEIKAMSFSDGKDGENGKDGVDGKDGENGKDGSPDTGEEIIKKINNVTVEDDKYKIDAKHIKNLPENTKGGGRGLAKVFTDDTMEGDGTISNPLTVVSGGGGVQTIVAGANISVDSTDPANPIVTSLSDRYKTTSTTSQAIVSTGTLTFTVDANLAYTPQQDVMIVYDASNHMHGTVNSYSGTTLVVDITHKTGSGTYASWTINLDGLPAGGSGWELTGNAGTTAGTNFIGTTDDVDHVFKRNNVEFFRNRKATNRSNRTEVFLPQGIDLSFARSDGYFLGINTNSNVGYGDNTLSLWGVNGMNFSVHNGDFTWYNSSSFITPRMTLKNTTGNFLIGTTTDAGYKLDVNGTGIFRDVLTIKKAGNSAGIILEETTPGYYSPDIQFKGISGNVFGKISVDYMNLVIGAGSNKYVGFGLVGQAGDYAVTINSYPYGVNTAPNNFVQRITQTANNAVGLVIKNSTAQSPSPTANFLEFRNASNSVLSAVTSGGSLLLGTSTDAGYKLDVNGTGRFSDNLQLEKSTSSGVGINVYNPLYTNRSFRFYLNGASAAVPSWNNATIIESYAADGGLIFSSVGGIGSSNAPFIWQMGGARGEVMRVATSGNLLIGTSTNAGYKLDVAGSGIFRNTLEVIGLINVRTPNNAYPGLQISTDNSGNIGYTAYINTAYHQFITGNGITGLKISSPTAYTSLLTIATADIVIGNTATAGYKFDLLGTSIFRSTVDIRDTDLIKTDAGGTVLSKINADGSMTPASIADATANAETIYYSTDTSKPTYKDSGGNTHIMGVRSSGRIDLSTLTPGTSFQILDPAVTATCAIVLTFEDPSVGAFAYTSPVVGARNPGSDFYAEFDPVTAGGFISGGFINYIMY